MRTLIFTLACITLSLFAYSQNDSTQALDTNIYKVVMSRGEEMIGKITKQDAKEIHLTTTEGREVIIPQYVVKKIEIVDPNKFNRQGQYVGEDKFATRYFITTNGLPVKKGENYVQWNLFGPDFQFAVADDLGVGIMTSWFGMPIIGSIKKSWKLEEKTQLAVGALVGTGSWSLPEVGGALPFATLSFGDRKANIAFSGGYGAIWDYGDVSGRALTSVAGMVKVSPKISLVFDSFILLPGKTTTETYQSYDYWSDSYYDYTYERRRPGIALIIPGIRWHQDEGRSFQFGFAGLVDDGWLMPVPIPMVQWYRTI